MFNWIHETFHGKISKRVAGFRSDVGNHPLPHRQGSERSIQANSIITNGNLKRKKTAVYPRHVTSESEQVTIGAAKDSLVAKHYFDSFDNLNTFSRQGSPTPKELGYWNDSDLYDPKLGETTSDIVDQYLSRDADNNGVAYRTIHGLGTNVVALTETSITNWNTIIQYQQIVDKATQQLDDVETEMEEREALLRRQGDVRAIPKEWDELYRQRRSILDIMKRAEREMATPRTQIYNQLRQLLENENLIGTAKTEEDYRNECDDEEEGNQSVEEDDGQYQQEDMSPHEVDQTVAEAILRNVKSALDDAKARLGGSRESRETQHEDQLLSIPVAEYTESGDDCEHAMFDEGPEEMEVLRTPFVYEEAYEHELYLGYDTFPLPRNPEVEDILEECRQRMGEPQPEYTESWAAQQTAEIDLHGARRAYQNAKNLVDNWDAIVDENLEAYLQEVEDENNSITQSEFDCTMLGMSRTAIRNLIKAEEIFEEIRAHALEVGLLQHHVDQESGFPDYPDDGYRESFEAGMVEHVNRDVLYKWIEGLDAESDGASVDHYADSHWDVKTVDVEDTFSNYAEGRYRKGIDAWELKCAEMRASLPAELLHFRNLEDDRIEAALKIPGRLRSFSCSF